MPPKKGGNKGAKTEAEKDEIASSFLPPELLAGGKKKDPVDKKKKKQQKKAEAAAAVESEEEQFRKAEEEAAALAAKVESESKPKEYVNEELAKQLRELVISPEVVSGPVVGNHAEEAAKHPHHHHCDCGCEHEDEEHKHHDFWDKQPVVMPGKRVGEEFNHPIHSDLKPEDVPKEPVPLPKGYSWATVDITDDTQLQEMFKLLEDNYVEDDDNMFRFDYAVEFLRWALLVPGAYPKWNVGIRDTRDEVKGTAAFNQLVAVITGVPITLRIHDRVVRMAEINFLCVHKDLRSLKLAPMLIQEVTRQVHLCGMFQAVYTAGVTLPTPFTEARYYHRSLNPKKLVEVGFSGLSRTMTIARAVKLFRVPEKTALVGLRPMEAKDVAGVHKLLTQYLAKFDVAPIFSVEEVEHFFLPRPGVMNSYVVEDPTSHALTAFGSFYSLPSSILNNQKYKRLNAAYLYYCVNTHGPISAVVSDLLVLAKQHHFDVFNCLELMDNASFLKDLKFGPGDGTLHYYLFNWAMAQITPNKLGLVLV